MDIGESDSPGVMVSTDFDEQVWQQAGHLVKTAFGSQKWQRLVPDEKSLDATAPTTQCIYVIDPHTSWREVNASLGTDLFVEYRVPGTHPDEDMWESAGELDDIVKVEYDDTYWYVAALTEEADAFLMIPAEIAKSLCARLLYRLTSKSSDTLVCTFCCFLHEFHFALRSSKRIVPL